MVNDGMIVVLVNDAGKVLGGCRFDGHHEHEI